MSKICTKCDKDKELDQFPKHKAYKDGFSSWCRSCLRSQADKWYINNKGRFLAKGKEWQNKNPRSRANSKFKARYGITIEDYGKMALDQNEQCAICKKNQADNLKGKLFVDHCHTTGTVRGLLCSDCNTGLGRFKDKIELLIEAAEYVRKTQPKVLNGQTR